MPKYAIMAVVEAPQAQLAWEGVSRRLIDDEMAGYVVAYVGAPWLVPDDSASNTAEYGVDAIQLQVNGTRIDLQPID